MSPLVDEKSATKAAEIVARVRSKGVKLWLEGGQLLYKAPRGVLTANDADCLRATQREIVAFLEELDGWCLTETVIEPRTRDEHIPLTFSQLHAWNGAKRTGAPGRRTMMFAMQLEGPLDFALLRESIHLVACRHESLRTRIVGHGGSPVQIVDGAHERDLSLRNLTNLDRGARDAAVRAYIKEIAFSPVDWATGPLFEAGLAKLDSQCHVLVAAMDHIISDAISRNILQSEILATYTRLERADLSKAEDLPLQFADYAVWQTRAHARRVERHGGYWERRLRGCERFRLPVAAAAPSNRGTVDAVSVRIGRQTQQNLHEWVRRNRTTTAMAVFTAYVAVVLRWYETPEMVFPYQTDGRIVPELSRVIGYLATVIYLRIALESRDTFVDLLKRITQEYCTAQERSDLGYIRAHEPEFGFTRNPGFNWVQYDDAQPAASESQGAFALSSIEVSPEAIEVDDADTEPGIVFTERADGIDGVIIYRSDLIARSTILEFSRDLLRCLEVMLQQPDAVIRAT